MPSTSSAPPLDQPTHQDLSKILDTAHSDNADALVWALMMVLSAALVLVPFIPGVRAIPKATRVYRLIWRDHYRNQR